MVDEKDGGYEVAAPGQVFSLPDDEGGDGPGAECYDAGRFQHGTVGALLPGNKEVGKVDEEEIENDSADEGDCGE